MNLLFLVLIAMLALDALSTVFALRAGGEEANPLLRPVIARLGAVPALVLVKGVTAAALWYWRAALSPMVTLMLIALFAAIVIHNVNVWMRQKNANS